MPSIEKMHLTLRCVDIPPNQVWKLEALVEDGVAINFRTFARYAKWQELAAATGYATRPGEKGLRLSEDFAVRFFKSMWDGKPCVYMVHSAIEFIFTAGSAPMPIGNAWH